MDEGPFRMPRTTGRSTGSRSASTPDQAEVEEPVIPIPEPKPIHRPSPIRHTPIVKQEKSKKLLYGIIAGSVLALLIIIVVTTVILGRNSTPVTAIDTSKYQAILLTNGESYLGKLAVLNDHSMVLTDVFYLKPQTDEAATDTKNSQQKTTDESNVQLIKFGGEVQGPEDKIVITTDQIVYYENLKTDGKAAKAIDQYKKSN